MRNPIDVTAPQEEVIGDVVRDALDVARALPAASIEAAIRRGSAVPLFSSSAWKLFQRLLGEELPEHISEAAAHGARHATKMMRRAPVAIVAVARKPILLDPEIAELGGNWARLHAGKLIRGIDSRTRATIRRLVRNASRRLARNPRGVVLAQLAREIRDQIGLTAKQASRIRRELAKARRLGKLSEAEIAAERLLKIDAALDRRALSIADREVAESFNEGVIRAARLAEKKRRLLAVPLKVARTVGDERVRSRHTLQANLGAIPLPQKFAIFAAFRPPWPGEPG